MTRLRSDILYVAGAMMVLFLAIAAFKAREISHYELWPDYARWALEFTIVAAFAFVAGYTLAITRREKPKEGA